MVMQRTLTTDEQVYLDYINEVYLKYNPKDSTTHNLNNAGVMGVPIGERTRFFTQSGISFPSQLQPAIDRAVSDFKEDIKRYESDRGLNSRNIELAIVSCRDCILGATSGLYEFLTNKYVWPSSISVEDKRQCITDLCIAYVLKMTPSLNYADANNSPNVRMLGFLLSQMVRAVPRDQDIKTYLENSEPSQLYDDIVSKTQAAIKKPTFLPTFEKMDRLIRLERLSKIIEDPNWQGLAKSKVEMMGIKSIGEKRTELKFPTTIEKMQGVLNNSKLTSEEKLERIQKIAKKKVAEMNVKGCSPVSSKSPSFFKNPLIERDDLSERFYFLAAGEKHPRFATDSLTQFSVDLKSRKSVSPPVPPRPAQPPGF